MEKCFVILAVILFGIQAYAVDSTWVKSDKIGTGSYITTKSSHNTVLGNNSYIIGGEQLHVKVDSLPAVTVSTDSLSAEILRVLAELSKKPNSTADTTGNYSRATNTSRLDSVVAVINRNLTELSKKPNANAVNPQDSASKYFAYGDTTYIYNPNGQYMLTRAMIGDSANYATVDSCVAEVIRNGVYVKIPMRNLRTGVVDVYMSGGNGTNDFFVPEKLYWMKYIRFRRVNTVTASGHSTLIEIRSNQ